jgi:hypothetical protein
MTVDNFECNQKDALHESHVAFDFIARAVNCAGGSRAKGQAQIGRTQSDRGITLKTDFACETRCHVSRGNTDTSACHKL